MCLSVLSACMYVHMCGWCPQKALDPLGLGLQTVVSHHVGAVNKPGSSARAPSTRNCSAISPAPGCANFAVMKSLWFSRREGIG